MTDDRSWLEGISWKGVERSTRHPWRCRQRGGYASFPKAACRTTAAIGGWVDNDCWVSAGWRNGSAHGVAR